MSAFLLPKGVIRQITKDMSAFWWNSEDGKQRLRWLSWNRMQEPKAEGGLGFKDLELFNIAMLAKQAWKIHSQPSCLLARIYKAKRHQRSTFLEATLGTNPSWGWRSIVKGKELLTKGLRWVIKDGNGTRVWDDPWIPGGPPVPNSNLRLPVDHSLKVNDLMNEGETGWDRQTLNVLFDTDTVGRIMRVPMSISGGSDVLRWMQDSSGAYTVKSGYRTLAKEKLAGGPTSVRPTGHPSDLFKVVWKINVPNKVRSFLWKVTNNILPTLNNINQRGIGIYDFCPVCTLTKESQSHLFFGCKRAREVWSIAPIGRRLHSTENSSFIEVIRHLLTSKPTKNGDSLSLIAWLLWCIWTARNETVFRRHTESVTGTVIRAITLHEEWKNRELDLTAFEDGIRSEPRSLSGRNRSLLKIPPQLRHGGLICAVDASWLNTESYAGLGCAAWDTSGLLIRVQGWTSSPTESPLAAEALAIRAALFDLMERGTENVVILSDCKTLVDALTHGHLIVEVEPILDDIRCIVSLIHFCSFYFIPRTFNGVADELAVRARVTPQPALPFVSSDYPSGYGPLCIPFLPYIFDDDGGNQRERMEAIPCDGLTGDS